MRSRASRRVFPDKKRAGGRSAGQQREALVPAPLGATKEGTKGPVARHRGGQAPPEPLVTGSPAGSAAAGEGSCQHGFRKNLS